MIKKAVRAIIKLRYLIIALILILIVASGIGVLRIFQDDKINSDMLEYIGNDFDTGMGLAFLKENFNINGDAMIVVEGTENDTFLQQKLDEIAEMDGVTQLLWYGTLDEIVGIMEDFLPFLSIFGITLDDLVDTTQFTTFLRQPIENSSNYNYVVMIMLEYPPSSRDASNFIDEITNELSGRAVAFAGMSQTAKELMSNVLYELPLYLLIGILAVVILLLLITTSYIEPFVIIFSLGVAIIVNMASNYFLPATSIVSFAASAVLQLGCTLDFSIIFINTYKRKRQLDTANLALQNGARLVFPSIITSALISAGGLISLYFIGIDLGKDMAIILAKGVLISLVTVIILLPSLLFMLDKLMIKSTHKRIFNLRYKMLSHFVVNQKALIIALSLSMLVAVFVGQSQVKKSYFEIYQPKASVSTQEDIAKTLNNQLIISVPVKPKDDKSHKEFITSVNQLDKVDRVLGAFTAIKMEEEDILFFLNKTKLLSTGAVSKFFSKVDGEWYTLYTVVITGSADDEEAVACYDSIVQLLQETFDDYYNFGVLTGVSDMAKSTPIDFWRVTLISTAIIALLLCLLLKSIRKGLFVVLLFQLGVWLNLTISTLSGVRINFLIYILISVVQLCSFMNYAIFMIKSYEHAKRQMLDNASAVQTAVEQSAPSILSGMVLLALTCLSVYFVSRNLIVKDMAMLLMRGGFIGAILSITVLPAFLAFCNKSFSCHKRI